MGKPKKPVKKVNTVVAFITDENYTYLRATALETGYSLSKLVDMAMSAAFKTSLFKNLEVKEPRTVVNAREQIARWEKRRSTPDAPVHRKGAKNTPDDVIQPNLFSKVIRRQGRPSKEKLASHDF